MPIIIDRNGYFDISENFKDAADIHGKRDAITVFHEVGRRCIEEDEDRGFIFSESLRYLKKGCEVILHKVGDMYGISAEKVYEITHEYECELDEDGDKVTPWRMAREGEGFLNIIADRIIYE